MEHFVRRHHCQVCFGPVISSDGIEPENQDVLFSGPPPASNYVKSLSELYVKSHNQNRPIAHNAAPDSQLLLVTNELALEALTPTYGYQ